MPPNFTRLYRECSNLGAGPSSSFYSFFARTLAAEEKVVADEYDYIITGGGLAGCLLADRLSEDGKKVLVLEAGHPDYTNMFIRIPAGILRLFRSKYDWQFETGGEEACNGRNVFLQRGKVSRIDDFGGDASDLGQSMT